MESLSELRAICQTTAKKDVSNIYMRYVCRAASIHLTRMLIPTAVTADQVSCAMILVGILASLMFLCVNPILFFLGVLLLQFWYVLDCVDGELARYRDYQKRHQVVKDKADFPITGAYWDYLNHYIVHGLIPFTVGFGIFSAEGNSFWILLGFLASLGQTLLLAIHDTKSRLFLSKLTKLCQRPCIVTCETNKDSDGKKDQTEPWSFGKRIFVILHYSATYPTAMNVLTLLVTIGLFAGSSNMRKFFLAYYAVVSLLVFLGLAKKNLRDSSLDKEFDQTYSAREIVHS